MNFKQKAKLHEQCLDERKKEVATTSKKYSDLMISFEKNKKNLDRAELQLKCKKTNGRRKKCCELLFNGFMLFSLYVFV